MKVTEAVFSRKTVRAFLERPVEDDLIRKLLEKSSRAPSGGNLQPWRVFVINNKTMHSFLDFQKNWTQPETPSYAVY
ncbi:MAG: nitroreductase family protein, partial [SAR86 cluster bacterium]|nr:nitroreductase family protein [SAR86 cluster bacterium]